MFGSTGSLLSTRIPKSKRKRWVSVLPYINQNAVGTDSVNGVDINNFPVIYNDRDVSYSENRGVQQHIPREKVNNTDETISHSMRNLFTLPSTASKKKPQAAPTSREDLHVVCFTNETVDGRMNNTKSIIQNTFNDAKIHNYPYNPQTWPAQLIVNIRDAAIVTAQFPDIYKEKDTLLFVNIPEQKQDAYGYTGYVITCIHEAKVRGSSMNLFLQENPDLHSITDEPGDMEANVDDVKKEKTETTYGNCSFAIRCDLMNKSANDILQIIKKDEESGYTTPKDDLLRQLVVALQQKQEPDVEAST